MPNLSEIQHYDDPVDQWAAEREFALRRQRYEYLLNGGLAGVFRRMTEAMVGFRDAVATTDPER